VAPTPVTRAPGYVPNPSNKPPSRSPVTTIPVHRDSEPEPAAATAGSGPVSVCSKHPPVWPWLLLGLQLASPGIGTPSTSVGRWLHSCSSSRISISLLDHSERKLLLHDLGHLQGKLVC
jgi:hypothetical protein